MTNEDSGNRDDRSADAVPEDVSNQNREEPSAPHAGAEGTPGATEEADTGHPPDTERSSQRSDGATGGAGESSQATGHPQNAG